VNQEQAKFDLEPHEDEVPPVASPAEHVGEDAGPWVLTNRYNLLEILSSGLIAPLSAYTKHYADLLDKCGEEIVVLRERPSPALLADVAEEGLNNFPVLLQLEPDAVGESSGPVLATGCMPLSAVTHILFPSEEQLRDHAARRYENVPDAGTDQRLRSSPSVFLGGAVSAVEVSAYLDARPAIAAADWRGIDRVRGAASALVAAAAAGVSPDRTADALAGRAGPVLEACLSLAEVSPIDAALDANTRLGLAVVRILGDTDARQAWSPRKTLAAISKLVEGGPRDVAAEMKRNLAALRGIVTGDRDFERFRDDARGLTSVKALLLVLLRSELASLLEWPREETNADDATLQLAAALVGRLRGLTVETQATRHPRLDQHTATWACAVANGAPAPLRVPVTVRRDAGLVELLLEGHVLVEREEVVEDAVGLWRGLPDERKNMLVTQLTQLFPAEVRRTVLRTRHAVTVEQNDAGLTITIAGPAEFTTVLDEGAIADLLTSHVEALTLLKAAISGLATDGNHEQTRTK
jgi:hypothetical protein